MFDSVSQTCIQCDAGWGVDDKGKCFACPANSLSCNLHNVVCEPKRYLSSKDYACLTCHGSCHTCEVETGKCHVCENQFNVRDPNNPNACMACRERYGPMCLLCDEGIDGPCISCTFGNVMDEKVRFFQI